MTGSPVRVLILGASYGMLPGVKLSLAGHRVTLVGRADEIAAMARDGLSLTMPLRRNAGPLQAGSLLQAAVADVAAPGAVALVTPENANPQANDFVILAMQEPQFAAPEVGALIDRIVAAGLPCLSIMNLPPLPFLASLGTIPDSAFEGVYASEAVWRNLPAELLTVACPDAQAIRPDPMKPGHISVTLTSNFKAAPFIDGRAQMLLDRLAHDMSRLKLDGLRAPVLLLTRASRHAPLAKWPMLIAGNCRCVHPDSPRTIAQAVHDDLAQSREIYEEIVALIRGLGTPDSEIVPFASYAKAAHRLTRPSSLARALAAGAVQVERTDRLIVNLQRIVGTPSPAVDAIAGRIEDQLALNRGGL